MPATIKTKLKLNQTIHKLSRLLPLGARNRLYPLYLDAAAILIHGSRYYPKGIGIEMSTACNRACGYCPVSTHRIKQRFITDDLLVKIIQRLREFRYDGCINFSFYNEPLIDPNFSRRVKIVHDALPGCILQIYTNGDKLERAVLAELMDAGISTVWVSRHPPYKYEWDKRIFALAKEFPRCVEVVEIGAMVWRNRGGLVRDLPLPNVMAGATMCRMPEYSNITIDGDMLLCCCDFNRENSLGNLNDKSMHDVYFGQAAVECRRRLRRGDFNVSRMCQECIKK